MEHPGLVIFDCDGVLVDSDALDAAVTVQFLLEHGMPLSVEETARISSGLTNVEFKQVIEARHGVVLPPTSVEELTARIFAAMETDLLLPIPGADYATSAVVASVCRLCVASNGEVAKMRHPR